MRFFDILLAIVILVVLSPVLIICSSILLFTGEGKIFYLQERCGRYGKPFKIVKFATMLENSPNLPGGTLTLENDPRVLPFGRLLRKSKINELPQVINILFGEMSFVGPRPLIEAGDKLYSSEDVKLIRSVRPGLTGLGSIMLRDEESYYAHLQNPAVFYSSVIQPYKASLEIYYVTNRSFMFNFKIIVITFLCVVWPRMDPSRFLRNIPKVPNEMVKSREERKLSRGGEG